MSHKFTCLFIISLIFVFCLELNAEEFFSAKYIKLGGVGSLNYIMNQTEQPIFSNSPACGQFNSGKAWGYSIGISALYPIYGETLFLDGRAYFEHRPADLTQSQSNYQLFNSNTNTYDNITIRYNYAANLDYLIFDLGLRYKPFKEYDAYTRLSLDIGNPIIGTDYTLSEEIETPKNYVFPDGTARHNISSGKIDNAGTSIGLNFGLIYEFRLDNGIFLSPELSYRYAINSAISSYDFKSNILKLSLSAMWKINFENDIVKLDTIIIEDKKPIEVIDRIETDTDIFKKFNNKPLNIIETTVTQTYPILPYVFFDENSTDIRKVYNTKCPDNFSEENLPKETMGIYYNLLNIIGNRIKENKSTIEIRGTTDGNEAETKDERIKLARKRAETVADYFIKELKISRANISITAVDLPELQTSTVYNEGYEENRRVELISNDIELFRPVIHKQFSEFTINDDKLEFEMLVDSAHSNSEFIFMIHNDSSEFFTNQFKQNQIGKYSISLSNDLKSMLKQNQKDIKISVKILDLEKRKTYTKTVDLDWEQKISNYELGRLNLIVFDFDKFELNQINKDMISNFITNSIKDNSQVSIVGSTDKLGEKQYNKKLSEDRASNTANFIKKLKTKLNIKEIKGIGDTNLLYDNNLPEGRFYCRTVLIEVKTPINHK